MLIWPSFLNQLDLTLDLPVGHIAALKILYAISLPEFNIVVLILSIVR